MGQRGVFLALLVPVGVVLANGDPFAFMPDGGRGSFFAVFAEPQEQRQALAREQSVEDWKIEIAMKAPEMGQREIDTLASYLAAITPLEDETKDVFASLPKDGRDLALNQCQSCHSLFSGYLMQRRDRDGWLSTFASPFHTVIEMTDVEKAIFADYSAINMPMKFDDVPPELRF